jgi:hypothetical protein
MAKDFNTEPEEQGEVFIDTDYNPLNEPINEKPYTKPNVTINPEDLKGEIPEPDFTPPPMGSEPDPFEEQIKSAPKKQQEARPQQQQRPIREPYNPELQGASKKEFKKSARVMAEMIMSGYDLLHKVGNNALQISEKKVQKLVQEDKLNLSMRLPIDNYGNEMSVGELIQEYNEQNKNTLVVDPEWKEETMPILTEVLEKRGIGATPEQQLAFQFAKDIGQKGVIVFSQISIKKAMINSWTMLYEQNKGIPSNSYTSSTPVTPSPSVQSFQDIEPEEFDPLSEQMTEVDLQEDTLSVNYQVNKMTNPEGASSNNNGRRRGRPKKS